MSRRRGRDAGTVPNNDTIVYIVEKREVFGQVLVPALGVNILWMRSLPGGKEVAVRVEIGDRGLLDIVDHAEWGLPGVRPEHAELALGRAWHDDEHFCRTCVGTGPCEAYRARLEPDGPGVRNWIVPDCGGAGLGAEGIVGRDAELREKAGYNASPNER